MILTIIGWLVIIAAAIAARVKIQHVYNMPTDYDRYRSWRYRRAVRRNMRKWRRG